VSDQILQGELLRDAPDGIDGQGDPESGRLGIPPQKEAEQQDEGDGAGEEYAVEVGAVFEMIGTKPPCLDLPRDREHSEGEVEGPSQGGGQVEDGIGFQRAPGGNASHSGERIGHDLPGSGDQHRDQLPGSRGGLW